MDTHFSISELSNLDGKVIEDSIFIISNEGQGNKVDNNLNEQVQYVKIKRTNYFINDQFQTIIQFIDISNTMKLYDNQKDHSEFLELVNACISHELRNPLNSIIAQNLLKIKLYAKLEGMLDKLKNLKVNGDLLVEM